MSFRICRWRWQCRWPVEAVVGVSGLSSLSESAGGGGGADWWLRLQAEDRVAVVFKNLQVEAAVQMAGRGSRWRFRLKLSFRICMLRRWCRLLVEAAGGGSG